MCRSDITPNARPRLGQLLADLAAALAAEAGVPAGDVRIGPVDFGDIDRAAPVGASL